MKLKEPKTVIISTPYEFIFDINEEGKGVSNLISHLRRDTGLGQI